MEEAFVRMMGAMEQQQKMINQLLEAQAQTHTQMMTDQQAHQEQQLILHQQLQDAMNQLASQQPVEQQRDTERRHWGLYIHRVKTFFMAKNLNYEQNEVVEARCLAMVVANIQGQAAAWTFVVLMIKSGVMNGKVVKILIDSGATNSLCRVGLGKHVILSKAVRISGYDGLMSPLTETRELKETVQIGTFMFHDTQLTEWDLKDKAFDIILGQPWFNKHNPVIDWRKHNIVSVDEDVDVNASAAEPPG
ncbi:hypothetical protein AaE_015139 [Aphanomyces astaci]|uniref:Peptidase A2 domain-containing protein n=1 Tax=Aphanomyces astaci TaxID=112090 RepID=A0A6A4Z378_APHAT|nr:hypothetical protein AaE_015139 [Aphanomyces astaci]